MKASLAISDLHLADIALLLNTLLADEYVLYTKTKLFHWNVESPNFYELHLLLDEQAKQLEEIIDEVAERTRALGHYAVGSLRDFLALARLLETKPEDMHTATIARELLQDHELLIHALRHDISTTASFGDAGSSDFLTNVLQRHEKTAWMLRAFLPGRPSTPVA